MLITGITGQDGSYLAEFLLDKGYQVTGLVRQTSNLAYVNIARIQHNLNLIQADLLDPVSLREAIQKVEPEEVYNLASQSHPSESFRQPIHTAEITALGAHRVLDATHDVNPKTKFYQASSSEMYGWVKEIPQDEETPFNPANPYAAAKLYAHAMTKIYRASYDMFAVCGILFNHESPRRHLGFVTQKVTYAAACAKLGIKNSEHLNEEGEPIVKNGKVALGNLAAKRDWGFAGDYCVDLDTSILSTGGFKYYDQLLEGDIVLNYNSKTNQLERDIVRKKVLLDSGGKMYVFKGRGFKLRCSVNHRIYYQRKSLSSKGGWSDWKVCSAEEFYNMLKDLKLRTKYDFRLPHTQGYKNKDVKVLSNWFKLLGFLLSEGCVYDGNRSLRISLSQSKVVNPDVYSDINACLASLKLSYRTRERIDGVVEFVFNAASSRQIISYFDGFDIHRMPRWVYGAGDKQLGILLKAMMDGDGSWGSMTYVSKRKDLVFDFQTLATILGYRTILHQRKSGVWECVLVAIRKKYSYVTEYGLEKSEEKVWCVTTKNGTIVTNKDGGIAVSGNCEAMWLMMQQDKPDDFVIATGKTHTIRDLCVEAFLHVGLGWEEYVVVDKRFIRPTETGPLIGDAAKARKQLGWKPKVNFKQLISMMVDAHLARLK